MILKASKQEWSLFSVWIWQRRVGRSREAAKISQRLGVTLQSWKEEVEKARTGKRKIRESYYYVICPLQTDRRHWPFIFLNLRFQESLCCSLISHTQSQAGVNVKVPVNPTLDKRVNLGNIWNIFRLGNWHTQPYPSYHLPKLSSLLLPPTPDQAPERTVGK